MMVMIMAPAMVVMMDNETDDGDDGDDNGVSDGGDDG